MSNSEIVTWLYWGAFAMAAITLIFNVYTLHINTAIWAGISMLWMYNWRLASKSCDRWREISDQWRERASEAIERNKND